jgi:hypothetical protein
VREADGTVFIRVWQENVRTHAGREFVRIWQQKRGAIDPTEHGRHERLRHVEMIRGGARCYLIMCEAVDWAAKPRRVRRFNTKEIFPGGAVQQFDGDWWVELLPALPVEDLTASRAAGL